MNRVLLVDDHATFREPLAFMFEREPDFEVVAQAGSLTEARCVLEGADLAVVDLDLPDGDGTELLGELRSANPRGMVLVLTASSEREAHARAVEAGAAGVLHKSVRIGDVIEAARRLVRARRSSRRTSSSSYCGSPAASGSGTTKRSGSSRSSPPGSGR